MMKPNFVCVLFAVFLFAFAPNIWSDVEDTVEKSFSVPSGGTLVIDSDLGSIHVTTGESNRVLVKVRRSADTASKKRAEEIFKELKLDFLQEGDRVEVTARYERGKGFWEDRKLRLRFEVEVPKKFNVDLRTAGGSISVADLQGCVDSRTSGGSLNFGNIAGPVNGKTSGGSINLEGCKGDAQVRTSGGSIHIGNVEGRVDAHTSGGSIRIKRSSGKVTAETSGGSIHVEEVGGGIEASTSGGSVSAQIRQQPQGDCRLTTSGGGVTVTLASDIRVMVDAKTSGGQVYSDFPVTTPVAGEMRKSQLKGTINGGGPELYLRCSGGNIYIKKIDSI